MELVFDAAKTGTGSRNLSVQEAIEFLEYCSARGWVFQSVEAFEIKDGLEYPDFRYAILGLSAAEKKASSANDLYEIAKSVLQKAAVARYPIEFKVWVDEVDNVLAGN